MDFFFFNETRNLQAVPTLNGTSFENGPVSVDLYSTPQYQRDQHSDCTGELFAPSPQLEKRTASDSQEVSPLTTDPDPRSCV